jgi:hypothetical protein
MKTNPLYIASVLSFFGVACGHMPELKPDPAAPRAPGNPNAAFAEVSGVKVLVAGDAWNGDPKNLPTVLTPVKVTLDNQSGRALKVNYDQFKLSGGSGFTYSAIPPMQARVVLSQVPRSHGRGEIVLAAYQENPNGQVSGGQSRDVAGPVAPRIVADRFFVAPHFSWYYPGWAAWPYGFAYDPFYYDRLLAYLPKELPTKDMLAEALPAGVLQAGGRVSGFVYFQGIGDRETRVKFEMDMVDAGNGEAFGHVSLPFEVKK